MVSECRRKGHTRTRWLDTVKSDTNTSMRELKDMINRKYVHTCVHTVCIYKKIELNKVVLPVPEDKVCAINKWGTVNDCVCMCVCWEMEFEAAMFVGQKGC